MPIIFIVIITIAEMKRKSGALVGSDYKKARWESGLDIDLSKDWEDLQVDIQ